MGRVLTAHRLTNAAASCTETNPCKEQADKRPQYMSQLCGQEESKCSIPEGGKATLDDYTSTQEKRNRQDFIWCHGGGG